MESRRTEHKLTNRQRRYLSILRSAEAAGESLAKAARSAGVPVQSLYTLRYQLRRHERHSEPEAVGGFERLAVVPKDPADRSIEVRTELRNGQPLWLSVPASDLATVLQALNA